MFGFPVAFSGAGFFEDAKAGANSAAPAVAAESFMNSRRLSGRLVDILRAFLEGSICARQQIQQLRL